MPFNALTTAGILLAILSVYVLFIVYAERKIAAAIQDRLGPYEVGPKGILQTLADMLKLLQKQDLFPKSADKIFFFAAPLFLFVITFVAFSFLPFHNAPAMKGGLLLFLALISLDIFGFLLTGWTSNSRYPFLGSLRAVSQMLSYEIPLSFFFLSVIILTKTLDLQVIEASQKGGILNWNVFQYPHLWVVFIGMFIAGLAETHRAPFDLPEAESELVAGFNTEYSGFRWSLFFFVEYEHMLLFSLMLVILFLGGGDSPLPDIGTFKLHSWTTGIFWKYFWWIVKSAPLLFLQIWIRWTYPRLRADQLIKFSWKILLPLSFILLIISILWQ